MAFLFKSIAPFQDIEPSKFEKANPYHDERGRFSSANRSRIIVPMMDKDYAKAPAGADNSFNQHINPKTGRISAERRKLYEDIISKHLDAVESSPNPTVDYMGGGGGSGKTFMINQGYADVPTKASSKAVHINPDDIKEMLPEYDKMRFSGDDNQAKRAAGYVHEESSLLAKEITRRAIDKGCSIVIDGTGSNPKKIEQQVEAARQKGYQINGHYVNTPFETAMSNNKKRFENPGEKRWVDEEVLKHAHVSVSKNFESVLPLFDKMTLYHNDGKSTPVVIANYEKNGMLEVRDSALYQSFLGKGAL